MSGQVWRSLRDGGFAQPPRAHAELHELGQPLLFSARSSHRMRGPGLWTLCSRGIHFAAARLPVVGSKYRSACTAHECRPFRRRKRTRSCLSWGAKVHHWRPALLRVVVAVVAMVAVAVTVVCSGSVENCSDTGCNTVSLLRLVEAWCSKGRRQEVGVERWACWLRDRRTIGHRYRSPRRH